MMEQVNQRLDDMDERIDAIVRTLSSASIELSNLKQDIKVMKLRLCMILMQRYITS